MGLLRFLAIFFLVYLMVVLVRGMFRSRRRGGTTEGPIRQERAEKKRKIIPKDEGEYVDFEEVDDR